MRIVILCEDLQQAVFVRYYFQECGVSRRRIEVKSCPRGKQSGEQYVRDEYAREVSTLRSKGRQNIALVAVIDGDTYPVLQRLRQLDQRLEQAGLRKREDHEYILIFVPKRNIETWIHYAAGRQVNEEEIYSKLDEQSQCLPYAKKLAREICPSGLPDDAPSSLHEACKELMRLS